MPPLLLEVVAGNPSAARSQSEADESGGQGVAHSSTCSEARLGVPIVRGQYFAENDGGKLSRPSYSVLFLSDCKIFSPARSGHCGGNREGRTGGCSTNERILLILLTNERRQENISSIDQ